MTATTDSALTGLKVVDLSRVLAGPLCTQMLADHGADVIKVEPPSGDETRHLGPPFDDDGRSAYYAALNRGKRSISLDLSKPEAQEVLHRLLADADVLVENFLPGTMERWGLGYEQTLAERYPRLVYCAVSGFGCDGPMGGMPGYDAVLQALCGIMSVNGSPETGATRLGLPLVDHLTGYVAFSSVMLALQARQRTEQGQRVEAVLYDTAISLLLPHASNYLVSGHSPGLLGSAHPNIAPYDKFHALDGELFIGIVNDGQFRRFCSHLHLEDVLTDARFASNALRLQNRDALKARIEHAIALYERVPLCSALMRGGVPAAPVHTVQEALNHAHSQHRQLVMRDGNYTGLRSPMRLTATPGKSGSAPPAFAQDCESVLVELGFSDLQRQQLHEVGAAPRAAR
jgi:crotonobetainyl-CoA:carnitine CoA-transferase CaiB-like acyl-CoA transferase